MVLPWVILLMRMFDMADCQVSWPADKPDLNDCIASNGKNGICHEFRSTGHSECVFFPSDDTKDETNAQHLENNICRNSGKEIYFCCPSESSPKIPEVKDPQIPEVTVSRPSFLPNEDVCGISLSNNIVGGQLTSPGEFPWLAAMGANDDEKLVNGGFTPFCGAILITTQHVLTAAHCFERIDSLSMFVRLGEYDVDTVDDGALDFQVIDTRKNAYNRVTKTNDIIILKLDRSVNITDTIRPVCLPHHLVNETFEGNNLIIAGWGVFDLESPRISAVPLKASVPVVPINDCQKRYDRINSTVVIDNRQLCAGTGRIDTCRGDSGGPIEYLDTDKGRSYIVGITSFGPKQCGSADQPGVYTRVGSYLDWIEESIKEML